MATNDVFVFAHLLQGWAPAGRLTLTQDRDLVASRFAYGTRYIDRPDALEVDPVSLGLKDRLRASEMPHPTPGAAASLRRNAAFRLIASERQTTCWALAATALVRWMCATRWAAPYKPVPRRSSPCLI